MQQHLVRPSEVFFLFSLRPQLQLKSVPYTNARTPPPIKNYSGMETSDPPPWGDLIPDALGLIFNKLPLQQVLTEIPSVCKSWRTTVKSPHCWQIIDISDWSNKTKQPEPIHKMLRMLINWSSGSLKELRVSYVNDHQTFSFIAENAGSLHTLIFNDSEIGDSMWEQVANKFSNLTSLDMSYCQNITSCAIESIGRNCKSLSSFTWNINPFENYSSSFGVEEVRAVARSMPRLKSLSISCVVIDTPTVYEITRGCPELELLDFRGSHGLSFDKEALKNMHPGLKVLDPTLTPFVDGDPSEFASFVNIHCGLLAEVPN